MAKTKRLTKRQQALTTEWMQLVPLLGGYFLQHRPAWQRGTLRDDLQGEGFLALVKAARTYDPKRLPYPKAYFARAILNSMLKWIKRSTRTPAENRVPIEMAEEHTAFMEDVDHLRLAIEELDDEEWEFATQRFVESMTLRGLAAEHKIPVKVASARSHALAKRLAAALGIQLPPPAQDSINPAGNTKGGKPS